MSEQAQYVSDSDACPVCDAAWKYEKDGKTYSHLIGIYSRERDMTVAWRCPVCEAQWERGARVESS